VKRVLQLAGASLAAIAVPAIAQPDFTGSWERYPSPGETPDPRYAPTPVPIPPPLKPEYLEQWREHEAVLAARQAEGQPPGDDYVKCLPDGMPAMMQGMFPMEIFQRPEQINITQEAFNQTRRVYMGETLKPASELDPMFYGHSVGHWEGETLVIDAVGFNEKFWMSRDGLPHTDRLHLTERFTRTDFNTLKYEVTIDDPGAYTAPWTSGFSLRWTPGIELFEYQCQGNNFFPESVFFVPDAPPDPTPGTQP